MSIKRKESKFNGMETDTRPRGLPGQFARVCPTCSGQLTHYY